MLRFPHRDKYLDLAAFRKGDAEVYPASTQEVISRNRPDNVKRQVQAIER